MTTERDCDGCGGAGVLVGDDCDGWGRRVDLEVICDMCGGTGRGEDDDAETEGPDPAGGVPEVRDGVFPAHAPDAVPGVFSGDWTDGHETSPERPVPMSELVWGAR